MKKITAFLVIFCSLLSCRSSKNEIFEVIDAKLSSGKLERIADFQSDYVAPRNVDIWLPPKYDRQKEYTTLYMLDGQMLFDASTTWNGQEWKVDEVLGRLISQDSVQQSIVVGIWNAGENRHAEYFPQKPFKALSQNTRDSLLQKEGDQKVFSQEPYSDDFLKFLVHELRPFINENYSTKPGPKNTFIAGSSMGGLISWYAVCEYPDVFGGAACLSTHWPGTFAAENNPIPKAFTGYLNRHLPSPENHKFYFDYGTKTLDAMYEPFQEEVDTLMKAHGFTDANWVTMKFEGADHSERSWQNRLHLPLKFLLGK
ncbi:MAG: alpha/beta hydrolase-fold protein [Salinimicrobium sp.]